MSRKFARLMIDDVAWPAEVRGDEAALLDAAPWHEGRPTGRVVPLAQVRWLPVSEASKVVAVAQNYKKHAAEMGKPIR
jgi:2-keto-4-pentenoate hydratase/2-oxohepta-3-ene-1,7-dioic acid hydratase in catechol pathway